MEEEAKAVQEVAKTTGKLVEAAEKVGGFISKVVGGASNQVGGIVEDWARYYRYKNLLAIADKVNAIHAGRRIEGKTTPVSARIAVPMLDLASLEDDENLRDVWARLIANSLDPSFKQSVHPSYIEIIHQLSPDEAVILDAFSKQDGYPVLFTKHVAYQQSAVQKPPPLYQSIYQYYFDLCRSLSLARFENAQAFLDNLQRLRIVDLANESHPKLKAALPSAIGYSQIVERDEYLKITAFGAGFVAACIKNN